MRFGPPSYISLVTPAGPARSIKYTKQIYVHVRADCSKSLRWMCCRCSASSSCPAGSPTINSMRGPSSSLAVALLLCVAAAGVSAQTRITRTFHLQLSVAVNGACTADPAVFNNGFRNNAKADAAKFLGLPATTVTIFSNGVNDRCKPVTRQVRPGHCFQAV
jgi:hypothetical protein